MSRRKISQREAHALKRRVAELEAQNAERLHVWAASYPGGTHVATLTVQDGDWRVCQMVERLGYVLVAKSGVGPRGSLNLYAVKP